MKLKQKLMALAIMGIAAAVPAHAAITNGAAGNGELFLTVFDAVGQQGYTLDLNVQMNTFMSNMATAAFTYNYSADALMTSFLNGVLAANKPNLVWAVGAEDGSGINRYLTTSSNLNVGSPQDNGTIKTYNDAVDVFLSAVSGKIGAGNSAITIPADGDAYVGAPVLNNNWGGKSNFTTTGLIGAANKNNLWLVSQTSTSDLLALGTYAPISQVGNQIYGALDTNGNLTFAAAVPEADTWAMFAAGLLVVGAIARRRMAV